MLLLPPAIRLNLRGATSSFKKAQVCQPSPLPIFEDFVNSVVFNLFLPFFSSSTRLPIYSPEIQCECLAATVGLPSEGLTSSLSLSYSILYIFSFHFLFFSIFLHRIFQFIFFQSLLAVVFSPLLRSPGRSLSYDPMPPR